jgi:hypothetical protein
VEHDAGTAPKNIVILCDGTGNEISENISNVLKLYRCLRKTEKTSPRQVAADRRGRACARARGDADAGDARLQADQPADHVCDRANAGAAGDGGGGGACVRGG